MLLFQDFKLWLMALTGLSKDALHIYIGLGVFFGAMLLAGWRVGAWRALVPVLLAALAGEIWDIAAALGVDLAVNPADNWHDIWNTMFWPVAITLLARWTRIFHLPR